MNLGDSRSAVATLELIASAAAALDDSGVPTARLDAELLLADAAGVAREQVLAGRCVLDDAARARFGESIRRRASREPLAYITGRKEFRSLEFEVTPDVLIPRPETETLVDAALACLRARSQARVLDLGTGSGAIAIAIASRAPGARIVATDVSDRALAVAQRNAERHGVAARIEFRCGSWFNPLHGERFDAIVANPPYVPAGAIDALAPEVGREPRLALAGGDDGLDAFRQIARGARGHLAALGDLLVEVGDGQVAQVVDILAGARLCLTRVVNDLAGVARVVQARV